MQSETKSAIASATLHAGVLGFALLTFSGASLEATQPPPMPIDLVSTEDFSKLAKGTKDAPKAEAPKPLVEKKAEEPKPVEKEKPKVTEKKEVEAAKAEAPPPEPEPKPDPIAEKLKQEKPKTEAKAEKIDRLPPKRPPQKHQKPEPKFDLDKIAALLDKREPVRQASAGRELNNTPSLGAAAGTEARLSQSELDALRARLRQCWNPPVGIADAEHIRVIFRVIFRRDGSINGAPSLVQVQGAGSNNGPVLAESARRAMLQCQPYKMLKPEHYEVWKDMEITFDPHEMFGG